MRGLETVGGEAGTMLGLASAKKLRGCGGFCTAQEPCWAWQLHNRFGVSVVAVMGATLAVAQLRSLVGLGGSNYTAQEPH